MTSTAKQEELRNILQYFSSDKEWVRTKVEKHPYYTAHQNSCTVCNKMQQLEDGAIDAIEELINQRVLEAIAEIKSKAGIIWGQAIGPYGLTIGGVSAAPLSAIEQVEKRHKDGR